MIYKGSYQPIDFQICFVHFNIIIFSIIIIFMYKLIIHRGYTVLALQWEIVVKTTYSEDGTNYKIPRKKTS